MPFAVINLWQKIWGMSSKELGGERNYKTDFEIYDEGFNPSAAIVNIYIGLQD